MAGTMNEPRDAGRRIERRSLLRRTGLLAGAIATLRSPIVNVAAGGAPVARRHEEGTSTMVYSIEGRSLEVCTRNILCPCWVGQAPDGGTCDSSFAWQIHKGLSMALTSPVAPSPCRCISPAMFLAGNWSAVVYIDDGSTDEQQDALLKVFTGQLGGAIADLAGLITTVVAVERVPITFTVEEGKGTLTVGTLVEAELAPFQGSLGVPTTLNDTVFTTIPGSAAYVGKASRFWRDEATHGLASLDIAGNNAIQGQFRFEA